MEWCGNYEIVVLVSSPQKSDNVWLPSNLYTRRRGLSNAIPVHHAAFLGSRASQLTARAESPAGIGILDLLLLFEAMPSYHVAYRDEPRLWEKTLNFPALSLFIGCLCLPTPSVANAVKLIAFRKLTPAFDWFLDRAGNGQLAC